MKVLKFLGVLTTLIFISNSEANAQCLSKKYIPTRPDRRPSRNVAHQRNIKQPSANVSYDAMTTILNVDFPANSLGGTVEVFKNGSRIGAMTSGAGTTFGCVLMDYGVGQYSVIVTHGNTVLYSKNIEVK